MKFTKVVLTVVCAFALGRSVLAQDGDQKAAELTASVKAVLPVDAKLTKEMHTRFWLQLNGLPEEGRKTLVDAVNKLKDHDLARQRAMWLSMKETLRAKKAVVDPAYHEANRRLREALVERGQSTKRLEEDIEQFQNQLEAIAGGKPISRGDSSVKIDMKLITEVLAGLDGSYGRLNRLLDPVWRP